MRPSAIPRVCGPPPLRIRQPVDYWILGIGPAVVLADWTRNDTSDTRFSVAAGSQINYLLNYTPHTDDGAISHRADQVQLWYGDSLLAIDCTC